MALLTARDPWDGKSALDTAAILGRTEILQFFISKEVSLNDTSTKGGPLLALAWWEGERESNMSIVVVLAA